MIIIVSKELIMVNTCNGYNDSFKRIDIEIVNIMVNNIIIDYND